MRKEVLTLWNSVLDTKNEDRIYDMFCFLTHILNGEITKKEIEEIMKGQ